MVRARCSTVVDQQRIQEMKKLGMMMAMALTMAMGAGACVEDEASPVEGAPLSAEQRAALEANPELQALREQLASTGNTVALDEARVFERDEKQGIICPVNGPDGQAGQFSQLTVQQRGGGAMSLALERNEQHSPLTGAKRDEALAATGIQCEPNWFPGRVIGSYCDWSVACWFGDTTYNVQEHVRTCCAQGVGCWEEHQNFAVRGRCGC